VRQTGDAVRLRGLRKRFGDVEAVAGVDLAIPRGRVFGLLGPNGAGKTTTLRLLCGLLKPDAGAVEVLGGPLDRRAAAGLIGLCPQEIVIWEGLKVREQLEFLGRAHDVPAAAARRRAAALLDGLGLADKADALAAGLSGGMKRRLNIALALVHDPPLLVLDEPQAGLDPQSRLLVRDFILACAGRRTVVLTTHDMEEADKLSDRVAILDHGRVLVEGGAAELKARHARGDLLEFRLAREAPDDLLRHPEWSVARTGGRVRITAPDPVACLAELRSRLAGRGLSLEEVRIRCWSLEDLFITLTGRALRE